MIPLPRFLPADLPAVLGLLPPALWLAAGDPWFLPRLLFCALLVFGWQLVFAALRRQGLSLHGLSAALLLAILLPASAPFWQLALGISFGLVLGEAIFGGRGRGFVQPVVLALAFLTWSFADHPWREGPDLPLVLALPGLALLVLAGQARLPVLLGAGLGLLTLGALVLPGGGLPLLSGTVLLGLGYLTADPVASGATTPGRWLQGALAGSLIALFASGGPAFGALIFASLLAAIFAPLIDHLVLALHCARMRRRAERLRHG